MHVATDDGRTSLLRVAQDRNPRQGSSINGYQGYPWAWCHVFCEHTSADGAQGPVCSGAQVALIFAPQYPFSIGSGFLGMVGFDIVGTLLR